MSARLDHFQATLHAVEARVYFLKTPVDIGLKIITLLSIQPGGCNERNHDRQRHLNKLKLRQ